MPASIIASNSTTPKKQKIRVVVRNATEEDWLKVDPKIDSGEIVFTSDKNTLKVGDGQTKYSDLTPIAGGGSGTTDYEDLSNKPSINNVTLSGDKTASDLGLATAAQGSLADTALQPGDNVSDLVNDSGFITGINSTDVTNALGYTPVDPSDLSTVATTGDYDDLINKPALGTAAYTNSTDYDSAGSASTAETAAKNYADSLASNYATAAQGSLADTAVQPGDLSNYVTTNTTQTITGEKTFSGKLNYCAGMTYILAGNGGTKLGYWSYDIDGQQNITLQTMTASTRNINFKTNNGGKVTYNGSEIAKKSDIPTNVSAFTNDAGYITGINSSDVTSALGYTPVDPSSLATVATTGAYSDLSGTPTIPTVNDSTIVITQGGITKGSFSLNQASGDTIALDAGGLVGDFVPQYSTIPTADVSYADQIVQYKGTTDANYTNGYFYKCVENSGVYSWAQINAQPGQVNADWDAVSGVAEILNKPTLGTAASADTTDFATAAQGTKADNAESNIGNLSNLSTTSKSDLVSAINEVYGDAASSVQSVTEGVTDGTIDVDGVDVPVHGLGTAAYTSSASYDQAGAASTAETNAKNYADGLASNYATAAQGTKADTALQSGDNVSDLVNDAGYLTSISSSDVTTALGYTPVESITTGSTNGTLNVDGTDVSVYGLGTAAYTSSTDYDAAGSATAAETAAKNYADSLGANYATAAQGSLADTAVQSVSTGSTNGTIDVDGVDVAVYGLGSAAYTASSAYATSAQGGLADTAVQPGDLATVATTGAYSDLSGTPTIPTVNNPTITITQGGVTKGSFTLNQSSGDTIALDAGGGGSSLPSQTGHSGEFLTTDGTDPSWGVATAVTFRIW